MPNKKIFVQTNTTKDSVKDVSLKVLTFQELWDAYPTGNPYDNPEYEDQCAIRMSVMLHRLGVKMQSFSEKLVHPLAGQKSIGRIYLDGLPTATRADEFGEWLQLRPIAGLPKPQNVTGEDWESRVKGRTGIIMFRDYWARSLAEKNPTGGHIDLWNGSRLTVSSGRGLIGVIGRAIRVRSAHVPGTAWGYSDLGKAREILFWEIK